MLKKLAMILLSACSIVCLPFNLSADYFRTYTITALDTTSGNLTLSDGSQWTINQNNLPSITVQPWTWGTNGTVFMVPIFPAGGWSPSAMSVVMIYMPGFANTAVYATMTAGSTSLTLTSLNQSTGVAVLSDGTTWQLDASYQKYYTNWAVGDPITPAGYAIQKYLINGSSRVVSGYPVMSFANAREHNSTDTAKPKSKSKTRS